MSKLWKFSPLILALGCSGNNIPDVPDPPKIVEEISEYDYDYYSGYNAAVSQFGSEYPEMIVDLSNTIIVQYANDINTQGYADGYHKALDVIGNRKNPQCPDVHQEKI